MADQSSEDERERVASLREQSRLYAILDQDPARAAAEARALEAGPELCEQNVRAVQAAIFIDAGSQLKDADLVSAGVEILRNFDAPRSPQRAYNLANGLTTLASLTSGGQPWRLDVASLRHEARTLYQRAARECSDATTASSSLTNQANVLKDSFRWVEAYDAYAAALHRDPANPIALSGISTLLRWRMRNRLDEEGPLQRVARRYLLRAHANLDRAQHYAGPNGVKRVLELMEEFQLSAESKEPESEAPPASGYAAFVRRNRLALCLEPEAAGAELGRWDHLRIDSISEPADADWRIPAIFAAWNVLMSDFLVARWLAYESLSQRLQETGYYFDTLDYANYGIQYSGLVLAQRAAVDVLDKIAVAATDYLNLPGNPQRVYFWSRWHAPDPRRPTQLATPISWLPEVEAEIVAGNVSLIAIAELAHDYGCGFLRSKKETRNSATHRFVVLHDILVDSHCRPPLIIERHAQADFEHLLIESLQVARAALMYFREAISIREARHRREYTGLALPMILPSHHSIRGEPGKEAKSPKSKQRGARSKLKTQE